MGSPNRDTVYVDQGRVIRRDIWPGGQFILRIESPQCAERALPGQFVHLRCDDHIPMRRPLSIQRVSAADGWIEVLFKTVGPGLEALSQQQPGAAISVLGPIGRGFSTPPDHAVPVLIGGGVGIPPLLFMAERLASAGGPRPVVFFGSELPFPFDTGPSRFPLAGVNARATHSLTLLEDREVPGRLASTAGLPGCHSGFVTELAADWLAALGDDERARCIIHACGPEPMLRAAQAVASGFSLPSWLCLEEFMACAVGGCAGCAVRITNGDQVSMKRVCVDGPVFDGYTVYPDL